MIRELFYSNPWWQNKSVSEAFIYNHRRNEFLQIKNHLYEKRILAILGPRRVGKSTLIYQTIDYLIKNNISNKRCLFISGDDLGLFKDSSLQEIIETYTQEVLNENFMSISKQVYIFIDEVHLIKNWELYLKNLYDKKIKMKFIVSGSSSTHLFRGTKDSLMGRMDSIHILPIDFHQFYIFKRKYEKKDFVKIPKIDLTNMDNSFNLLKPLYLNIETKIQFNYILNEYLISGGYLEYFETKDIRLWQQRLSKDIVTRGIYKDILSIYNIKSPEILEQILYIIAYHSTQNFSYTSLANELKIDTNTVINYLKYLSDAFIITVTENYSKNMLKIKRSNKKISILDVGLRNALLKIIDIDRNSIGLLIEGLVSNSVRTFSEDAFYSYYYYRHNKKEIDIIIDAKYTVIPIEVKYKKEIKVKDLNTISEFIKSNNLPYGIVITKDTLEIRGKLYLIPFWLFQI